jgi:Fe2+ transport system protein FeoA
MEIAENIPTISRTIPVIDVVSELSLETLPMGAQARVIAVKGGGALTRRLMEMGLVPGAPVRVIKAAPLGDPLEVRVRGYNLALRRSEARTISVVTAD